MIWPFSKPKRPSARWAVCHDCGLQHPLFARTPQGLMSAFDDWREKHPRHNIGIADNPLGYAGNADVKAASQAEQTMAVTALHSLASSATAGWSSPSVDNSSNLYLDAEVMIHLGAVNTAPGSDKAIYVFAYGSTDGTIFTSTGTSGGTVGTDGALTFPSISTLPIVMPLLGVIPYPVQNKAIDAGPFYLSNAFRRLPLYWGVAVLNFSGMALAASGNTVKYRGTYNTVI